MAYQPYYQITDWQNLPSQKTALNRKNLLHAENGIKEADNRIVQLDNKKSDLSLVNQLVKSVVLNPKSGVLTVTLLNGTVTTYDLDIERVVTNFDITDNNVLVLTLADGTRKEVDLTKFVNTFSSTATIAMSVSNRIVTAKIVDGSVTMGKLDAAIQREFKQYMLNAQSARDAALQYQKFAKRYAVGDEEFEGSDADNAKYYYEQAKTNAEISITNATISQAGAAEAQTQAGIATQKAINSATSANSASADARISSDKAAIATQMATTASEKATAAAVSESVAVSKAKEALESAKQSKRYAIGGVEAGDSEDNSKWYCQQAQNYAEIAQEVVNVVYPTIYIDMNNGHFMADGGKNFSVSINEAGHLISSIGSEEAA